MAINVSTLNRSILPRTRSLILGCVTPKKAAACAWVRPPASINLLRRIIRSDRTFRFVASSAENPRSRKTLPLERRIFAVIGPPPCGRAVESGRRDASLPARCHFEQYGVSASRRREARKWTPRTSQCRKRDIDRDRALALARAYFDDIPAGPRAPVRSAGVARRRGPDLLDDRVELPRLPALISEAAFLTRTRIAPRGSFAYPQARRRWEKSARGSFSRTRVTVYSLSPAIWTAIGFVASTSTPLLTQEAS